MDLARDVINWLSTRDDLRNQAFVFVFGAMVSMLMSIFSGERRSAGQLFAGSIFGGIGAVIAFRTYQGWLWEIVTAFSALGSERIALGARKVFEDFSKSPFVVVGKIINILAAYLTAMKNVKVHDDLSPESNVEHNGTVGQDEII
jgi:hypothetical protein